MTSSPLLNTSFNSQNHGYESHEDYSTSSNSHAYKTVRELYTSSRGEPTYLYNSQRQVYDPVRTLHKNFYGNDRHRRSVQSNHQSNRRPATYRSSSWDATHRSNPGEGTYASSGWSNSGIGTYGSDDLLHKPDMYGAFFPNEQYKTRKRQGMYTSRKRWEEYGTDLGQENFKRTKGQQNLSNTVHRRVNEKNNKPSQHTTKGEV